MKPYTPLRLAYKSLAEAYRGTHQLPPGAHGGDKVQAGLVPQVLAVSKGLSHHAAVDSHCPHEGVVLGKVGLGRVAHHVD